VTFRWDPARYLTYADERGRPFVELLGRVRAERPRRVVDLGCGPGNLTALLAQRWPEAEVLGLDSSDAMIDAARASSPDGVAFEVADLRDWSPSEPVDVLVSNATLQWVPGHLGLLPGLVRSIRSDGWLAVQVPGNFDEPSHAILRDLEAEAPYVAHARDVARPASEPPEAYWQALADLGCQADVWTTTYLHVLQGEDPVFTWISGTGARPILEALPAGLRAEFEIELKRRLRSAYPETGRGVVLPFRRIFAVAQVAA